MVRRHEHRCDFVILSSTCSRLSRALLGYTPGLLPDDLMSYQATGPDQVTMQLTRATRASGFPTSGCDPAPMPEAWNVSATGADAGAASVSPTARLTLGRVQGCLHLHEHQNKDTATYATNPLWQVVDGPWKLSLYTSPATTPSCRLDVLRQPEGVDLGAQVPDLHQRHRHLHRAQDRCAEHGWPERRGADDRSAAGGAGFVPPSAAGIRGYVLQPSFQFAIGFAYINFNNPTHGLCSSSCTSGRRCRCWTTRQACPRPSAVATRIQPQPASRRTRRASGSPRTCCRTVARGRTRMTRPRPRRC